jgi:predicted nucleic acid-binding protein
VSIAYVDSSVLVGLAFAEITAVREARRLAAFRHVITGSLTEAELASALKREGLPLHLGSLGGVEVVAVHASLQAEVRLVLDVGYLRGADCWHLAVALHIAEARDLTFVTLDKAQRAVATQLGFAV